MSFGRDAVIVLHVERMNVLPQVGHDIAAEVDDAGSAEDKVRQIVAGGVAGHRAAGGWPNCAQVGLLNWPV